MLYMNLANVEEHLRGWEKIKGRSDDMLKIRGVNVLPVTKLRAYLSEWKNVSPHYQLIVRREGFC